MIDLTGRQSDETKLRDSIESLRETIKATYQRNIHQKVHGGVSGAGHFGSSFFGTLGLTGLAESMKNKAEEKEIDRQKKEEYVKEFQESDVGQILTPGTARAIAEEQYEVKKKEEADKETSSSESEAEANYTRQEQLEQQTKTSEDITALYTITDDHFKKTEKYQEDSLKLLELIANKEGMGGGLLGSIADMAGTMGGRGKVGPAGKVGKLAGMAGKLGTAAKVGGGLLAVGTAAYDAYGDYSEAERQVQAGEITKEQGQVKKGEAVGGGIGAAGGALGGAKAGAMAGAALGSFIPGVGTVIGGAVGGLVGGAAGYFGGKWLGQKAGGGVVSATQAVTGTGAPAAAPAAAPQVERKEELRIANEKVEKETLLTQKQMSAIEMSLSMGNKYPDWVMKKYEDQKRSGAVAESAVSKPASNDAKTYGDAYEMARSEGKSVSEARNIARQAVRTSGQELTAKTTEVAMARENAQAAAGTSVNSVNAPVVNNINNTTVMNDKKSKNADPTFQKYVDRRFYPA